jgi:hypothetical protein
MAGQWVDDPSWGGAFDALFQTGKPGQAQLAAEHIKALQLKRAIDEADWAAQNAAVGRIGPRYDAMQPPRFLPNPNAGQPYTGGIDDVLANNVPPTTALGDAPFYRAREQGRADEILATRLSKTPAQLYQTRGLGQVTASGVPTSMPEFNRVQTMLKGELPDPNKAAAIHNYSVTDPATGEVTQGRTLNGLTDMVTGRPIPQAAAVFAGQPHAQPSPFGDQKAAQDDLARAAMRLRGGRDMSIDDVERARIIFDRAFPQTGEFVDLGGRKVWQITRKDAVPEWALPIANRINDYHSGAHLQPQPPQPQIPASINDVLANNVLNVPSLDMAAAPAVAPVSPDINQPRQVGGPGPVNAQKLSDDFRAEQPVKLYNEAVVAWNSLTKHAKGDFEGRFSNGSDLAIIYGIAKLMDPGSVVREGELNLARSLGSLPEAMLAWVTRVVQGNGILPARVRADLLFEGQRRIETYQEGLDLAMETYADRARRGGVDPRDVITGLPRPAQIDYKAILEKGKQTEAQLAPADSQPQAPAGTGPRSTIPVRPNSSVPPWLTPGGP